jgi:hypothetical protein
MQLAKVSDIILHMADQERLVTRVNRQNLKWLIAACEKRLDRTRGGQRYLARVIRTTETHLSALLKEDGARGLGTELKERIEKSFNLPPDWMDHEHRGDVVDSLVSHVPLLPGLRIERTSPEAPKPRTPFEKHLMQQIEQLRDELAQARSNRK